MFILIEGIRKINRRLDASLPWERSAGKRLLYQFWLDTIFAILVILIVRLLIIGIQSLLFEEFLIIFKNEMKIIGIFLFLTFIIVFIDFGIFILKKYRNSLAELERFKKENIEFNLEMLKNQVNPHFLFNSLNTLSSLIFTEQKAAAKFVRQLAKVYRYILENKETRMVRLRDELEILESYTYMQQFRFGENITFEFKIDEKKKSWKIVPLSLQMLIENAIKHNVISKKRPLKIEVFTDEYKNVVVKNNLQKKEKVSYSSGIGLKNIRSRYEYLNNRKIRVLEGKDYFIVKIPLVDEKSMNLVLI
jgi:LytS/YehU family sensor histidine kinase